MSQRLNKEELDKQFELFLKESVSDDSLDLGASEKQLCAKSNQKSTTRKPTVPWWQDDEDRGGGAERALSGYGKSFRKSLRKSNAIQEEFDDPRDTGVKDGAAVFSRDDTEKEGVDSMNVPAVNVNTMGLDTLEEEEEEKACFFAQLEAGASSTIDYSKLNRELDSMSSTMGSNLRNAEEAVEQNDDGQMKARVTETHSVGSPHYSEDFEDEENGNDPVQEESEMPPIIGKVCLFDSLDDTGGEDRKKDSAGSLERGHSYVRSGASEMEALHEAYRQIQVVEDSGDHHHDQLDSPVEGGRLHRTVSPSFPPQHDRQSLRPASTNESDLPTAEELMRPIRIEEDQTRGFSLQPVSALQHVQEKTPCASERTFPDESQKRPRRAALKGKNRAEGTDPAAGEVLQNVDEKLKEQEWLIQGYQQENEKLYFQLKAQQTKTKALEESLFAENQRLRKQTFTREHLNTISKPEGHFCNMDHAQQITDLLAQINTLQRKEENQSADIYRLEQENHTLEENLQLMKKERDLAKAEANSTQGDKRLELRELKEKHKEEVSGLKKKLHECAEKRKKLARDAERLKASKAQSHQLTEQVKQLEQILRHKDPNSLPALIYAAASAGGEEGGVDPAKTSSRIVDLQEARIQHLEAELENHDEEAKRSLKAVEQQFISVKLRYEQQITTLELQLEQKQQVGEVRPAAGNRPWMSQVQTLQKELQQEKENYLEREKSLHDQIESLQQQLLENRVSREVDLLSETQKPPPSHHPQAQPSPSRHQHEAEEALGARVVRLKNEVTTKTQTIKELTRTVERLQKERRHMLSAPKPPAKNRPAENKRQPGPTKILCSAAAKDTCGGEETFPAADNERTYQPTLYTGSHISEVLQESQALTERLELLELQAEQEKEESKAAAAQAKEELRRTKEHCAEQLSALKVEHLRGLDQLRATHALEHSSSKVAEQANMINSQEIKLKLLQEQLEELQGTKNALSVSRSRVSILERQLIQLLQELKGAKEAQSSEVKLLCSLERKILSLDLRQQHREMKLQQVIDGSQQNSPPHEQAEVERLKNLLQLKKKELMSFCLELDSILEIVKQLKAKCSLPP